MRNPFRRYESKAVGKGENRLLTRQEFEAILNAVDTVYPLKKMGGKGEYKNMYRPYLKTGCRLLLLSGTRREEAVTLKWNMIYQRDDLLFFAIHNLKVERAKGSKAEVIRYIPVGADLLDLLNELGFEEKKGADGYILIPTGQKLPKPLWMPFPKGFTYYKNEMGITADISMKNLRKTYVSWVKASLNTETRLVASHGSDEVLDRHYVDGTILSAMEKAALQVRIFGD